MNFFIGVLIFITVITSGFVISYRNQLRVMVLNYFISATASDISTSTNKTASPPPPIPSSPSGSVIYQPVPPGFRGPTGEPRIVGPKSNPPNY